MPVAHLTHPASMPHRDDSGVADAAIVSHVRILHEELSCR